MTPARATIAKGVVTPLRHVPGSIARPPYVGKRRADRWQGGDVHSADVVERIRAAGRVAAQALALVGENVRPGVTTDELDRIGHEFIVDHGAYPSTLGYPGAAGRPPFPKALCTSVNEVICHGIPDGTVIEDGDVVKVDITAFLNGVHGDNCGTFIAGEGSVATRELVEVAREATMRGIKAAQPGREVNVIGRVIEKLPRGTGSSPCATTRATALARRSTRASSSPTTTRRRITRRLSRSAWSSQLSRCCAWARSKATSGTTAGPSSPTTAPGSRNSSTPFTSPKMDRRF